MNVVGVLVYVVGRVVRFAVVVSVWRLANGL